MTKQEDTGGGTRDDNGVGRGRGVFPRPRHPPPSSPRPRCGDDFRPRQRLCRDPFPSGAPFFKKTQLKFGTHDTTPHP